VAVAADGSIYAAGVGTRQPTPAAPQPIAAPAPVPSQLTLSVGGAQAAARQAGPLPALSTAPLGVSGGSDLYRIDSSGGPRRLWTNSQDVVYAIAFDSAGRALLGSGNHGNIYRVESPATYTALLTVPATQVTAFQTGADGRIYAAAGNVGKVYQVDPAPEQQGTIESDVLDAGMYTQWGRVSFEGKLSGGQIAIQTRSGNLDRPEKNWSSWSAPISDPKGAPVTSPAARFVQWKATLTASSGASPELGSVSVAYLPKNVEPRIDRIEITPANYRFPAPVSSTAAPTLNLSALTLSQQSRQAARAEPAAASFEIPATNTPTMQYAKGSLGARWLAGDPNGDSLVYTVEIRGVNETEWKPLKDKLTEKHYSWDTTAFPDGEYKLRITASDAPSNPPSDALTTRLESETFLIDNTPPKITGLAVSRNGAKLQVRWHAADAINNVTKAEYSLDGGDWTVVAPVSGISDSRELDYNVSLDASSGEHTIAVRVEDAYDNQAADKAVVR